VKPEELEKGDRILFKDRSTPLTVKEKIEDGVLVDGPQGGEYELYTNEGADLVAKKGKRRYSSYAEDIRKVGKWVKKDDNRWKHSKTGAEIRLEENSAGFLKVKTDGIEKADIDPPKYGYLDRECAEEDVEKLIKKHPEGR
jgi:hypothetical protein